MLKKGSKRKFVGIQYTNYSSQKLGRRGGGPWRIQFTYYSCPSGLFWRKLEEIIQELKVSRLLQEEDGFVV